MGRKRVSLPESTHIEIDSRVFNEKFFKHLWVVHDYEIYYGGSGSGKSTFIGQKLACQMTKLSGRNLVCLRRQKTDCIASCWAEIYNALVKFNLVQFWDIKENPDHVMVNRVNGNTILFEGVDNIEDIKSIKFTLKEGTSEGDSNLTDVWYEEANAESTQDTINELDRRLRDPKIKCRIIISFNPVSRAHWLFEYVTKDMAMRGVDSIIVHTTYRDNRFLPEEYGIKLERMKYTSPYDYQVYALGNWGTMGQTVFDANKIQVQLDRISEFIFEQGDFFYEKGSNKLPKKDSYKLCSLPDGDISIFERPIPKHPYVIAIDTAGEGSDFFAAHVMDNITGKQVAEFHGGGKVRGSKKTPKKVDECVWQLYGLSVMYNYALVCPEINFDSWIVKAFLMMGYPNIYKRMSPMDKTHIHKEDRYGYKTGVDNRQPMLTDFVSWSSENMECIMSANLLNEMLTFTRQDKKLKGIWWGAENGEHDDLVIAFAILLQARVQQACTMIPDRTKLEKKCYTKDELDDLVERGSIDKNTVKEYIKENGYYAMSDSEKVKGGSRYVRR